VEENGGGKKLLIFICCAVCAVLLSFFIFNILIPGVTPEKEDIPDTVTTTPEESSAPTGTTPEQLAAHLRAFDTDFTVSAGSLEALLAETYTLYPELVMYYSGMSYRASAIGIRVNMSYRFPAEVDVAVTDSREGFCELIRQGLASASPELYIVVTGCADNPPSVADIIIETHKTDYIDYMGYTGGETSYTSNDFTDVLAYSVSLEYFTDSESLRGFKEQTRDAVDALSAELFFDGQSALERELAIHDAIIERCSYASDETDNFLYHTAYSAAVLGKSVCQGYAELAALLFTSAGIENYYVEGESKGVGHAWNIVRLGDGYYHVDLTWDDPITDGGEDMLRYDYFNLTDEMLSADHSWDASVYPACVSDEFMRDSIGEISR